MAAPGPASTRDSLKLMGYAAYVETKQPNGLWKRAEVFKPEIVHDSKITGYIVSTEDTEFRLFFTNESGERLDMAVYFYADGRNVKGSSSRASDPRGFLHECHGKQEDAQHMRPIKFAKLKLTDDDALATTEEQVVKNVGSISVIALRAIFGKLRKTSFKDTVQTSTVLAEGSKYAKLSHSSSFGDAIRTAPVTHSIEASFIDDLNDPYCTFQFYYLSRDLLEVRGIIPCAKGNAGSTVDSDSTPEIVVKNEKAGTKRKTSNTIIDIDDSDDESEVEKLRRENAALRKKVKTEPSATKTKPGQVIDLTDD